MTIAQTNPPALRKPLRLWPGVALAILQSVTWLVAPRVDPDYGFIGILGAVIGGLGIIIWWLFFSRALWIERLGAVLLMIVAVYAGPRIIHVSIAKAGMGYLFYILAFPLVTLVFVLGVAASRRLSDGPRRAAMVASILLAIGGLALLRIGGISNEGGPDFHWRWTPTPEERLLAQAGNEPVAPPATPAAPAPAAPAPGSAETPKEPAAKASEKPAGLPPAPVAVLTEAEWPGFRGPHRDSIIPGVRIATDWSASPPAQLWRRAVGPGWSSFAVHGDLLYTQEQRGEEEVVACYSLKTGQPVWMHRDAARFWEANAGPGPRGTPTLSNGRVYTFGGTGILNALDAASGAVVWSRNVASDTEVKVPYWGFASSPLVVDDVVVIAAAGKLAAYDRDTGNPRWTGPAEGGGYSSPHLVKMDGVAQVVLLSGNGATSVAPADGTVLWKHAWAGDGITQPALTPEGDILIGAGSGFAKSGMLRIAVAHTSSGWTAQERWTSIGLKPYFNDFVVHNGHAFGFDGSILSCIDLKDGTRKWKGGRYGNGQLILLSDQDLLLVITEGGDLVLVSATTDQFKELARFPAIEGKTWNHPVLVGDVLLVRNDQEMAAFRLSLTGK